MSKKLKGFSLAELLISLLVISIVLSAAIPTLTKKTAGSESIWRWANTNNSAYFGMGALQSAILGNDVIPDVDMSNTFMADGVANDSNVRFTTDGDKLVILKQSASSSANAHLMNSHIAFFTLANSTDATTNDITYAGRLALEKHNIALGIGSLQSLDDTSPTGFLGNNTALGHFTLFHNRGGKYNTAVGESSLANNVYAIHNTAIGYQAGLNIDKATTTYSEDDNAIQNTAIGSQALRSHEDGGAGRSNTAVGYSALYNHTNGVGDTAVGSMALYRAYGTGNTALGAESCSEITNGSFNVCLGLGSGNVFSDSSSNSFRTQYSLTDGSTNNALFIGTIPNDGTMASNSQLTSVPLIYGRMQHEAADKPRQVALNTTKFDVNTFNGELSMLGVTAKAGSDGATLGGDYTGTFDLRTNRISNSDTFFHITGDANTVYLAADNGASSPQYKDISFNQDSLKFIFGSSGTGSGAASNLLVTSNASTIDLFDTRFYISSPTTAATGASTINFTSDGSLILSNPSGNNITLTNNGGMAISSNDIHIGANNQIIVSQASTTVNSTVNMGGYDISFDTSFGNGGSSVRGNLQTLWQEIYNLQGGYSDERLKNISGDSTAGLKEINALEVKNFTYKDDKEKTPHVGVIAQQLQKIFPNSVTSDDKGYLRIKTEEIFFAMVNSIKELFAQVQDLTAKVTGLDKRLDELEKENAALKKQNEEFEKRLQKLEKKL